MVKRPLENMVFAGFTWLSFSDAGFFIVNSKKTRFYCEKTGGFCQSQWKNRVFSEKYGRKTGLGFFHSDFGFFLTGFFFSLTQKMEITGFFVVDFFELIGRLKGSFFERDSFGPHINFSWE
jgi:hypothetical protein